MSKRRCSAPVQTFTLNAIGASTARFRGRGRILEVGVGNGTKTFGEVMDEQETDEGRNLDQRDIEFLL